MYVIFVSVEKVSWTVRNDSNVIVLLQIADNLLLYCRSNVASPIFWISKMK
jgi:hypothetical protein